MSALLKIGSRFFTNCNKQVTLNDEIGIIFLKKILFIWIIMCYHRQDL